MASQYSIKSKPKQAYIGSKHRVKMSDISTVADQLPSLFSTLAQSGVQPVGAPLFRYYAIANNMNADAIFEIDVGVPVQESDTGKLQGLGSGVRIQSLPEGKYLETKTVGHPNKLAQATKGLLDWAQNHDLEFDVQRGDNESLWGGRVEWYETDPKEEPDMEKWVTLISIRLADQE